MKNRQVGNDFFLHQLRAGPLDDFPAQVKSLRQDGVDPETVRLIQRLKHAENPGVKTNEFNMKACLELYKGWSEPL